MTKMFLILALVWTQAALASSAAIDCTNNQDEPITLKVRLKDPNTGSLMADQWNGYPPMGLVWADFSGQSNMGSGLSVVSQPDKTNGCRAIFSFPAGYQNLASFNTKLSIQCTDRETLRADLECKPRQ